MLGIEPDRELSTKLNRLSEIARENPKAKFTSLAYLLNEKNLRVCYRELNGNAALGIDKQSYRDYGERLDENIGNLVRRMKEKRYKAQDIRRVWIPKADGKQRPLGILTLEDKIVQKGVAKLLKAIYEEDFIETSYGFRQGKNCHEALKSVELMIMRKGVNYLLDMDIKGFFDNLDQKWLMKMLKERITDRTILRLIGKWLKVGVMDEGKRTRNKSGVPQGGIISPILANVYLHYVLDLWITRKITKHAKGKIFLIRYADDFIIGCTNRQDAEKLWEALPVRLKKFGLEISQEKSRLIEFGKNAYYKKKRNGKRNGKLKTFDFLGFTHYMARSRRGGVKLGRKTEGKRMRKTLVALNDKLKRIRNIIPFQNMYKHLCRILTGYYNYYGFAGNGETLWKFQHYVTRMWFKWLNRRSQRKSYNWKEFKEMLKEYPLPKPVIKKPYRWIYSGNTL